MQENETMYHRPGCRVGLLLCLLLLAAAGCDDDGESEPAQVTLRLTNQTTGSIWVESVGGTWYQVQQDGEALILSNNCLCTCDQFPDCPMCDAPVPDVAELAPNQSVEFVWPGTFWWRTNVVGGSCFSEAVAPRETYTGVLDWGGGFTESEWAPGIAAKRLTETQSRTVEFVLGTDPIVEVTIQ